MRVLVLLVLAAAAAAACPAPTASITSVDGLAGGSLTSELSAPSIQAETVTAETLSASTAQLEQVASTSIEATASVTTPLVDAERVDADTLVIRGVPVFGAPLGTATRNSLDDGRGYRAVDASCREAFGPEAHVCGADEVMAAYRAGIDPPASMQDAAVNTFSAYLTVRKYTGDEAQDNYILVDDCIGWTSGNYVGAIHRGTVENSYGVEHSYLALHYDELLELWRLEPPFTVANCSEVNLACCG